MNLKSSLQVLVILFLIGFSSACKKSESVLLVLVGHEYDTTELDVHVIDPDHPVSDGVEDFSILDEAYSNISYMPGITPLLETDHTHAVIASYALNAGKHVINQHCCGCPTGQQLLPLRVPQWVETLIL